ncbi:sensor histidine kinase [Halosegnis sp.]|uniref:sensor histidine kinase n=1 Tax=Halosegnis sp. TaxID=2864959 RepID=UPI0035D49E94
MDDRRPAVGWWLIGPALGVWLVGTYLAAASIARGPLMGAAPVVFIEILILVGVAVVLTAGGLLVRSDTAPRAAREAGVGALVGAALVALIGVVLVVGDGIDTVLDAVHNVLVATGVGGVAGLFVGRFRGQTAAATAGLAAQRDAFVFLNRMLRHHVLNGANVISGHAELLAEELDAEVGCDRAELIRQRGESIGRLVDETRRVGETLADERAPTPVDVVALLNREVASLREAYPAARVRVETPETATVYGGEFLAVAFEHLLTNAVVHNDTDEPRVWVSVREQGDETEVVVRDNGPGLETDTPFEPSGGDDCGFGLYLVNTLVTAAGGEVTADGDDGTAFTVRLRRV